MLDIKRCPRSSAARNSAIYVPLHQFTQILLLRKTDGSENMKPSRLDGFVLCDDIPVGKVHCMNPLFVTHFLLSISHR